MEEKNLAIANLRFSVSRKMERLLLYFYKFYGCQTLQEIVELIKNGKVSLYDILENKLPPKANVFGIKEFILLCEKYNVLISDETIQKMFNNKTSKDKKIKYKTPITEVLEEYSGLERKQKNTKLLFVLRNFVFDEYKHNIHTIEELADSIKFRGFKYRIKYMAIKTASDFSKLFEKYNLKVSDTQIYKTFRLI